MIVVDRSRQNRPANAQTKQAEDFLPTKFIKYSIQYMGNLCLFLVYNAVTPFFLTINSFDEVQERFFLPGTVPSVFLI